jgi:hypothetical protein
MTSKNETLELKEQSLLIQLFGDTPKSRILDFLIVNKGRSFSKTEISRGANVFKTAFFKQNQNNRDFHINKYLPLFFSPNQKSHNVGQY